MRPKIILLVLLAGLAGVTGIVLLKHPSPPPAPAAQAVQPVAPPAAPVSQPEALAAPVTPAPAPAVPALVAVPPVVANPVPVVAAVDTNAMHEAAVQASIDKLQELQGNDDPASLKAILTELVNPDKQVRAAAIEATVQFGDRSAIPVLKDLAATTTDSGEKQALLDAVAFMSLPTMTEVHAAQQQ
jgi:hypothetical protein